MPVFHKLFLEWVELPEQNQTDFGDWLLNKGSNITDTILTVVQPLVLGHLTQMLWENYMASYLERRRGARGPPWRRLLPSWWGLIPGGGGGGGGAWGKNEYGTGNDMD